MIRAIVEQHAEDAAFLWTARRAALHAPHTRVLDLARLDERIEANLDGLRVAGHAGERLARLALRGGDAGEVFAAAIIACESRRAGVLTRLLEEAPEEELSCGLRGAVSWLSFGRLGVAMDELRAAGTAVARQAALFAEIAHRRDPAGRLLAALLDDDPSFVATALRAIGELRRGDFVVILASAVQSDDPDCRFWAAWSAALLSVPFGAPVLRAVAEHGGEHAEQAATIAGLSLDRVEAIQWFQELARRPERRRIATRAAAAIGDPKVVPDLLEWLDDPALGRIAADAIATITGITIAGDLAKAPPAPQSPGDDDDETSDPDEGLSWPDAAAVRSAWERTRATLPAGARYLLGHFIDQASLRRALIEGRQPERARAAFELARAGEPLFDVSAPFQRQRRALASLGG